MICKIVRRPLVLCSLSRYARMYESWGCVTLSYSAPGRALYMAGQEAELVTIAARLAALTTELVPSALPADWAPAVLAGSAPCRGAWH